MLDVDLSWNLIPRETKGFGSVPEPWEIASALVPEDTKTYYITAPILNTHNKIKKYLSGNEFIFKILDRKP